MNDTQDDCVACSQCDAGSYKSPGFIPCDGTSYSDTQGSCLSCEQECLPGEYRALCQQSAIESIHCEGSCTQFADLAVPFLWTGIFITGTATVQSGQPLWMNLKLNTSTNVTRTLTSARLPITVHKFIDGSVGQFGGAVTVTLESQSCSCSPCLPGFANGEDGPSPCVACAAGNFTSAAGSAECSICEEGKFAPTSGASVCQDCPAWAMSLPGKDVCTAKPAPPPSPFLVVIVVGSPMDPSEFTLEVQGAFRGAIAAAAGVDVMACQIADIGPAARRAGGSEIALEIGADSSDAAAAISGGLSADAINAEMAKAGLPGVSILSMAVVENDAFERGPNVTMPLNATDFWTQDAGPLQVWAWIAIGGSVLLMCCCSSVVVCVLRGRKGVDPEKEADKQITADVDTVIIDMKPRPIERESTLTGELVFEKVSSDEDEDGASDKEFVEGDEINGEAAEAAGAADSVIEKKKGKKKCEHCMKKVCTPKMDLEVELHGLVALASLNGSQGKVVKLYKKKRHCAVELEDGKVITVPWKHVSCAAAFPVPPDDESGDATALDAKNTDANADGEGGVPGTGPAIAALFSEDGKKPGEVDAAGEQDSELEKEPGGGMAAAGAIPRDDAAACAVGELEQDDGLEVRAGGRGREAEGEGAQDDVISVVTSVAPSLVASVAGSVAALGFRFPAASALPARDKLLEAKPAPPSLSGSLPLPAQEKPASAFGVSVQGPPPVTRSITKQPSDSGSVGKDPSVSGSIRFPAQSAPDSAQAAAGRQA